MIQGLRIADWNLNKSGFEDCRLEVGIGMIRILKIASWILDDSVFVDCKAKFE